MYIDYVALRDQYIGDRSLYETDSAYIVTDIFCDRYASDVNDCTYNTSSFYDCQQAVLTCVYSKFNGVHKVVNHAILLLLCISTLITCTVRVNLKLHIILYSSVCSVHNVYNKAPLLTVPYYAEGNPWQIIDNVILSGLLRVCYHGNLF